MKAGTRQWLHRDLLLRLMLPLLAILAASGALGTYEAHRLTDQVFDRWLLDSARSLAAQIGFSSHQAEIDLPAQAAAMLAYDDVDRIYYSVRQSGQHLLGQVDIPESGRNETAYSRGRVYDAYVRGEPVRVASVQAGDGAGHAATVLVAETVHKRERARQELMVMLLPLTLLLIAAAFAIHRAVRNTIRPLEAIAARWRSHSQATLQPIGADDVPRELMPFANALNDLLARMRALLMRERQFAADAAHQLRTPLAGLELGLARAAQAPDLESTRDVLRELGQATQRTSRLVQQLLALSRLDPETGRDPSLQATDLVTLAQDVGAAFIDHAIARRIELELQAPSQPVIARVQPELVSEALGNLIDNALRYTPEGGRVTIEVGQDPPALRVVDSGPGVPEEEREAVFERFVRGRAAHGEGSGLGLAIVRDIAALHGGRVSLSDSALGGASVTMQFPSPPPQPAHAR
ncbi:MAG TPA: sensor histidine kinase N-terminal domain-containing protein [Burkholderiaceae bacterium]|nr:sensor histidine kinase N-terminal domain-containing protein [Burkholderiaceae bacterium]